MQKLLVKTANESESGLPRYRRRVGYFHDEQKKEITIFYEEFEETPKGEAVKIKPRLTHVVKDSPEETQQKEIKDEDGNPTGEFETIVVTPAKTAYTDNCVQFKANAIGLAIDEFLKTLI